MRIVLPACLLLSALAFGCAEPKYAGLEFDAISAAPVHVTIDSDGIELAPGVGAMVSAQPQSSEEPYESDDRVTLRSEDQDVLDVFKGEKDRHFVLVGIRPGKTCLEVRINRARKDCIPVEVRELEP